MSRRISNDAWPLRRLDLLERLPSGVDLGPEPLDAGGATAQAIDRRSINLRWLGASILTGVAGATLLSAAIYVSLEGETTFAEAAERVAATARAPAAEERATSVARKGDKLVR